MSKKKFSHRQMAQLNNRQADREMHRITGERYVEDHQHLNNWDMVKEMATWF